MNSLSDAVEQLAAAQVLHDYVRVQVVLKYVVEFDYVLVALAFAQVFNFVWWVVFVAA
jgi:hypothetical protein